MISIVYCILVNVLSYSVLMELFSAVMGIIVSVLGFTLAGIFVLRFAD